MHSHSYPTPSFRPFIFPAILLMLAGWGGLAALFILTEPTVWPRWAFFLLWTMALTGTALPATYYLNRRFPSDPPAASNVILRQALWVGAYGATLAWLQLGRLVTVWVVLGLAGGLIGVEALTRLRERSQWRAHPPEPETPPDDRPA